MARTVQTRKAKAQGREQSPHISDQSGVGSDNASGGEYAGHNSQPINHTELIKELRARFRPPTGKFERLSLFINTLLFKAEYLLGGYILDTWETLLVYPIYFSIIVLFVYGVWRLGERSWLHISELLQ